MCALCSSSWPAWCSACLGARSLCDFGLGALPPRLCRRLNSFSTEPLPLGAARVSAYSISGQGRRFFCLLHSFISARPSPIGTALLLSFSVSPDVWSAAGFHFAFCPGTTTLPRIAFLCLILAGNQRSTLLSLLSCGSVKNLYSDYSIASTWYCVSLSGFCTFRSRTIHLEVFRLWVNVDCFLIEGGFVQVEAGLVLSCRNK